MPASTASCCCLYENWLMTLEPGLKEFVGLVLPSRLKSPPNKWYLQLRNWLRQRLQTRQEIHARFSRKLINIKVKLHNYKELFINIYVYLFYVSSCCQVIVALSSISQSRAELGRERGACRGVCAYKADISWLVVRSSVNPRARYLMVGWTWTDIDGCVWTICIIHMFNMQNAAGTQATACFCFQGYLYACLCRHAHTYTYICVHVCVLYEMLANCVRLLWNLQRTSNAVYK